MKPFHAIILNLRWNISICVIHTKMQLYFSLSLPPLPLSLFISLSSLSHTLAFPKFLPPPPSFQSITCKIECCVNRQRCAKNYHNSLFNIANSINQIIQPSFLIFYIYILNSYLIIELIEGKRISTFHIIIWIITIK